MAPANNTRFKANRRGVVNRLIAAPVLYEQVNNLVAPQPTSNVPPRPLSPEIVIVNDPGNETQKSPTATPVSGNVVKNPKNITTVPTQPPKQHVGLTNVNVPPPNFDFMFQNPPPIMGNPTVFNHHVNLTNAPGNPNLFPNQHPVEFRNHNSTVTPSESTSNEILGSLLDEMKKMSSRLENLEKIPPPSESKPVKQEPVSEKKLFRSDSVSSLSSNYVSNSHSRRHNSDVKFKDLHYFDGNPSGNVHPKDFVEEISYYFEVNGTPEKSKIQDVSRKLKAKALNWYQVFKPEFTSFDRFVEMFLATFWGSALQSAVRASLYTGQCPASQTDLCSYFLQHVRNARYLDESLSEQVTVSTILAHFPPDVRQSFTHAENFTVNSALALLQRIENSRRLPKYVATKNQTYSQPPPQAGTGSKPNRYNMTNPPVVATNQVSLEIFPEGQQEASEQNANALNF